MVQFQSILQHFVENGMPAGLQLTRKINHSLLQKVMGDVKLLHILKAQTQINHSGSPGGGTVFRPKKEKEATDSFPENVWENIMRWLAFVEECIFILPPPSLLISELEETPKRKKKEAKKELKSHGKENGSQAEKEEGNEGIKAQETDSIEFDASQVSELFLLRVHTSNVSGIGAEFPFPEDEPTKGEEASSEAPTDESEESDKSKWKDFHFAQRLLELVDILLFDNVANIGSHSFSRVKELEQGAVRHSLRLILYTLHESDAVLNTKRILHRRDQLGEFIRKPFMINWVTYSFPTIRQRKRDGRDVLP